MDIFSRIIDSLYTMPLPEAVAWIFLENFLIFALSVVLGELFTRLFRVYPVVLPSKTTRLEIVLACSAVLCNSLVTFAGLLLWRSNFIQLRKEIDWRSLLDIAVLFLVMDCLMYIFHRLAHLPILFLLIHKAHHRFEQPTPLTFFALNPIENLGFGALWLIVLVVYPASWLGITVYLILNVLFGL